jgi:hypothetical protein
MDQQYIKRRRSTYHSPNELISFIFENETHEDISHLFESLQQKIMEKHFSYVACISMYITIWDEKTRAIVYNKSNHSIFKEGLLLNEYQIALAGANRVDIWDVRSNVKPISLRLGEGQEHDYYSNLVLLQNDLLVCSHQKFMFRGFIIIFDLQTNTVATHQPTEKTVTHLEKINNNLFALGYTKGIEVRNSALEVLYHFKEEYYSFTVLTSNKILLLTGQFFKIWNFAECVATVKTGYDTTVHRVTNDIIVTTHSFISVRNVSTGAEIYAIRDFMRSNDEPVVGSIDNKLLYKNKEQKIAIFNVTTGKYENFYEGNKGVPMFITSYKGIKVNRSRLCNYFRGFHEPLVTRQLKCLTRLASIS